jgi:hypothetical protein
LRISSLKIRIKLFGALTSDLAIARVESLGNIAKTKRKKHGLLRLLPFAMRAAFPHLFLQPSLSIQGSRTTPQKAAAGLRLVEAPCAMREYPFRQSQVNGRNNALAYQHLCRIANEAGVN